MAIGSFPPAHEGFNHLGSVEHVEPALPHVSAETSTPLTTPLTGHAPDVYAQPLAESGPSLGANEPARPPETAPADPITQGGDDAEPPRAIPEVKTRFKQLQNPEFFGEDRTYTNATNEQLLADGPAVLEQRRTATSVMTSGQLGRFEAARFVNRMQRGDGDFRYAYGAEAWRAFRAGDARLQSIPTGQLSKQLDMELMKELSKLTYTPEDSGKLLQLVADARRGGHAPRPGVLRKDQAATRPLRLTEKQYQALAENESSLVDIVNGSRIKRALKMEFGKKFRTTAAAQRFDENLNEIFPDHKGLIVYAKAKDVEPEMLELLAQTRAALDDPGSDIVAAAAHFAQRFASIHPFEEGNGRISRLVMDRILGERGLPPPILSEMDNDVTATATEFKEAVAQGVRRSLSQSNYTQGGAHGYAGRLFSTYGVPLTANPAAPRVRLGSEDLTLGDEGFVYNEAGRPHLAGADGKLQALPQLNYYLAIRRIAQAADPQAALAAYTAPTRAAFQKLVDFPLRQRFTSFPEDAEAIAADNRYQTQHAKSGNEAYVGLFDPARSTPERLFILRTRNGSTETQDGTLGEAVSRYQVIDLDMWHAEQGLRRSGDQQGAAQLHGYREQLFALAKQFLAEHKDPRFVSEQNPLGFKVADEKVEYEQSPLAFDSLAAASRHHGDDKVNVWRGDIAAARFIGMGPDNIPGKPDAFKIARFRDEHGSTVNLFDDLASLEGSAVGSGYQSATARTRLLSKDSAFASKANQFNVDMTAVPAPLASLLKGRMGGDGSTVNINSPQDVFALLLAGRHVPKGSVDVSGLTPKQLELALKGNAYNQVSDPVRERLTAAVAERAEANPAKRFLAAVSDRPALVKLDDLGMQGYQLDQLAKQISLMRDYFTLTPSSDGKQLSVQSQRRAFLMRVDKEHALGGINALGGTFEGEQEIHLLANERPTAFKGSYRVPELLEDQPQIVADPVVPPTPEPAPALAPADEIAPGETAGAASVDEPAQTAEATESEAAAAAATAEPAPEVISDWANPTQA